MQVWSRREYKDHEARLEADDENIKLEKSLEALKRVEAENKILHTQLNTQTQFMQTVILELIQAMKDRPAQAAPVMARPTLSSYLDKKDNKPLNGPMDPAKLPG
jgi:hypothetical protein